MTKLVHDTALDRAAHLQALRDVREQSEDLCAPLEREDMVVQTMPDVSPTKWHLAHTTWFFETLVLERSGRDYRVFDEHYAALFNSYYQSLGSPYPRPERGLLSRPTFDEIGAYRRYVDEALHELLEEGSSDQVDRVLPTLTLGMNHEQQHQELMLMDVKHVLASNPLRPAYRSGRKVRSQGPAPMQWIDFEGGEVEVGAEPGSFHYDNEGPRHSVHLRPYQLASRPVTAGEYLEFMADGGYARAELWLADGWDLVQREGWQAPLYWERGAAGWQVMTLDGLRAVDPGEPVCHVSYHEADAFATWAGHRLPSELEWEHAASGSPIEGNLLESGTLHPRAASSLSGEGGPAQLIGDVWEWTSSSYTPYPGYQPFAGELGEYNGKFMVSQLVLRGGCCATPVTHMRTSYRNFYYPHQRWMFSGIRLAR